MREEREGREGREGTCAVALEAVCSRFGTTQVTLDGICFHVLRESSSRCFTKPICSASFDTSLSQSSESPLSPECTILDERFLMNVFHTCPSPARASHVDNLSLSQTPASPSWSNMQYRGHRRPLEPLDSPTALHPRSTSAW